MPQAERGARASLPAAPGIAPAPCRLIEGGGSRLSLAAPADRGPPTGQQKDGGQSPGAPSRRRGKPAQVERREDRCRRRVQRRRLSGFPARGVVRVSVLRKARGALAFRGTGGVQTHEWPAGRPAPGKGHVALRPRCGRPFPLFALHRRGKRTGRLLLNGRLDSREIAKETELGGERLTKPQKKSSVK